MVGSVVACPDKSGLADSRQLGGLICVKVPAPKAFGAEVLLQFSRILKENEFWVLSYSNVIHNQTKPTCCFFFLPLNFSDIITSQLE